MPTEMDYKSLKERADLAAIMIEQLKKDIEQLKQTAAADRAEDERAKLEAENKALRFAVEQTKQAIQRAQYRNCIMPVPVRLPTTTTSPPTAAEDLLSKKEEEPISPESQVEPQKAKKKQKKGKDENVEKKEKPKKEAKKPPEGEGPIDVSRLDFRVGLMVSAKSHPDADSLYVEEVDLGEEKRRTVVSGLVKHVPIEEMQNRLCVFLCNLKPAKMRGVLSEAMVMCASSSEKIEILDPPPGSEIGDRITFDSYTGTPDPLLNPKRKIWEQVAPDLRTSDDRVATYKGVPMNIPGKGYVLAPTLANVNIK